MKQPVVARRGGWASPLIPLSVAFWFALTVAALGAPGMAFAEEDNWDWLLKELKIADVEMGQPLEEVVAAIPGLDFDFGSNNDPDDPVTMAMLWHPAQIDRYEEGAGVETWALTLFFDRQSQRLFRIVADFPPPDVQTNSQLITSALDRLGPPEAYRSHADALNPDAAREEYLYGRKGMTFAARSAWEASPYLVINTFLHEPTGKRMLVQVEYTANSYTGAHALPVENSE